MAAAAAAAMSMTTTLLTSSLSFFHGSPLSIRAAQPRHLKSGLSITMSAANPSPLKFQPTKQSIVDGAPPPKMISGQKQKAADLALRAFGQGQGRARDSSKLKRTFSKSKGSFRKRLPPIQLGDRIDYRNMSLISRFISEQGKILSRRINRLTLKQQRQVTTAIKQARILSLLSFLNNEKQFERIESTPRTTPFRNRNR